MGVSYGVFRKETLPTSITIMVEVEIEETEAYFCDRCDKVEDMYEDGAVYVCGSCGELQTFRLYDLPDTDTATCTSCSRTRLERIDGTDNYVFEKYCFACDAGPLEEVTRFICQASHASCGELFENMNEAIDHVDEEHLGRTEWSE